jgi:ABC-2 type transport system ATP-binding protein
MEKPVPAVLEAKSVVKRYGDFALQDVSFTLEAGTITGLVGRNGAGKSTLIRGTMGLIRLDGGSFLLLGEPTRPFGDQMQRIGYVPDQPVFYEWMTVDETIAFMSKFFPRFNPALAAKLKNDFELVGSKPVRALSSGMRTKLSLLLALVHEPPLLILDEPTSGLDPIFRAEILDFLSQLRRSGTSTATLFSSHIISDVERVADKLVILRDGKVVTISTVQEIPGSWAMLVADRALEVPGSVSRKSWRVMNNSGAVSCCVPAQQIDHLLRSLSEEDRRRIRVEQPTAEAVLMELI